MKRFLVIAVLCVASVANAGSYGYRASFMLAPQIVVPQQYNSPASLRVQVCDPTAQQQQLSTCPLQQPQTLAAPTCPLQQQQLLSVQSPCQATQSVRLQQQGYYDDPQPQTFQQPQRIIQQPTYVQQFPLNVSAGVYDPLTARLGTSVVYGYGHHYRNYHHVDPLRFRNNFRVQRNVVNQQTPAIVNNNNINIVAPQQRLVAPPVVQRPIVAGPTVIGVVNRGRGAAASVRLP